jgi:hypothetical protein
MVRIDGPDLSESYGIAVDGAGKIYVSNTGYDMFENKSPFITVFAPIGAGEALLGTIATTAAGIALGPSGGRSPSDVSRTRLQLR